MFFIGINFSFVLTAKNKKCCRVNQQYSISKNFYMPHSFMSGSSTDLLQQKYLLNPIYDHVDRFLQISFLCQYQHSATECNARKNLGSMPFWSGTNTMTFGNNDGRADLDVYQFGFGDMKVNEDGLAGYINLDPVVSQVGADFFIYYMREKDRPGFYFKIHAPISSMTIEPGWKEKEFEPYPVTYEPLFPVTNGFTQITQRSDPSDPATSTEITYYDPYYPATPLGRQDSVGGFLCGGTLSSSHVDGNVLKPLRLHNGRLIIGKETVTKFAEFALSLGYNWIMEEKGFFGTAFKCSYPTGNLAAADFMLEPIVGRSGLLGIGFETSGKYRVWENKRGDHSFDIWFNGDLMHLIPIRKPNMRSFDLKQNGPGSKYLLVQNYGSGYTPTFGAVSVGLAPEMLHSAINITTLPVLSSIDAEGTFAFLLDYYHSGLNVAVGAEVWGRTQEHLSIDVDNAAFQRFPNLNDFAVLGRQHGAYLIDYQDPALNPVYTYYCEPCARINKSQDPVRLIGVPPTVSAVSDADLPKGIADARLASNRVPQKFSDALDIPAAAASSIVTAKVFAQIGFAWKDYFYVPSVGLHVSFEFAPDTNNTVCFWASGVQFAMSF